jgi:glycine dehydrogenase subunit 1
LTHVNAPTAPDTDSFAMASREMIESRHSKPERDEMLRGIGIGAVEELFAGIPKPIRFPALDLPEPLAEADLAREVRGLSQQNTSIEDRPCFLGAGSYRHFIPATVDYVLQRGEFYTAYTPYQPELSQGMLQAMFEYQSMICQLTGMEVSNASHYDGATSLAEAVLLSLDAAGGARERIIMSPAVHPHYREVAATYLQGAKAELLVPDDLAVSATGLLPLVDSSTAALVVQSPNYFGLIEGLDGLAEAVHTLGALLIVVADPVALGLFRPPGADGADVVVADGQPLGLPPSFGGPSPGIFATRREHIRRLVGRIVGETVDAEGRRGYVLTLATREQHIRRERATSNICTNSALGALAAAVHLATLGKQGLRHVAELCFHKSHYAAAKIAAIPGFEVNAVSHGRDFFKEFVVELPRSVQDVNAILLEEHGIIGGHDLGQSFPGHENQMLLAVTELNSRTEIDDLVHALAGAIS